MIIGKNNKNNNNDDGSYKILALDFDLFALAPVIMRYSAHFHWWWILLSTSWRFSRNEIKFINFQELLLKNSFSVSARLESSSLESSMLESSMLLILLISW